MVDSGARPWVSRASTSKVRSGCITCKHRRVKCDEAKPFCNNCQKVGRICGGYQLLPVSGQHNTCSTKVKNLATDRDAATLTLNPASELFETETEYLYFDFFLRHTSHKLSGSTASIIWTTIVPQSCVQNCSIRNAVVAIAALDKIAESAVLGHEAQEMFDFFGFRQPGAANHYKIAVKNYHKAIKAMGNELTGGPDHNVRNILIFCLLTVCFESYIGNQEAGNIQALTGNNLLSNWMHRARSVGPFFLRLGISSPSPNILEDDIVHAFIRLRQRAGAAYTKETSCRILHEEEETIKCTPQEFLTLREAKIFWELLENRIERLRIPQNEIRPAKTGYSYRIFRSVTNIDLYESSFIDDRFAELARWTNAFEGVLACSRTPMGNHDYLGATIVKMRSLIARSLCISLSCERETVFDKFYNDYLEIVALAKSVLLKLYPAHSVGKMRFRFDTGMVPTLFYLVILCRQRTLRKEALAILEAYPCREGTWDSLMAARIARWVIEAEEAGCEENSFWVPEFARLRIYSFSYLLLQCRGDLIYQIWEDGEYAATFRQVELTW